VFTYSKNQRITPIPAKRDTDSAETNSPLMYESKYEKGFNLGVSVRVATLVLWYHITSEAALPGSNDLS
jgi:hypothetical protein